MTDPLDRLRLPIEPADPPAAFVNALEARMKSALDDITRTTRTPAPRFHAAVTVSLGYRDAPAAIRWLEEVLGFRTAALYVADDGGINWSQLVYRDGAVIVHTQRDQTRLANRGPVDISLVVDTRDEVDRIHEHALALGATVTRPPEDAFYGGRALSLEDPEGNGWHISSPWLDSDAANNLPERRL